MISGRDLMEARPEIIGAFTRLDALRCGEQVDVSEMAKEAGIKFPVFLTRGTWAATIAAGGRWVAGPEEGDDETLELPCGQDVTGRIWDVVWLLRCEAERTQGAELSFPVSVYGYDGTNRKRNVHLVGQCGPVDADDPSPAITVMLPDELRKFLTAKGVCGQSVLRS